MTGRKGRNMVRKEEAYNHVYAVVKKEVSETVHMAHLRERLSRERYNAHEEREIRRHLSKWGIMPLYNKYKGLSGLDALEWSEYDAYYSPADLLESLRADFPEKAESDLLTAYKRANKWLDMPSAYHVCAEILRGNM
jgi:hypothetical protein